MSEKPSFYGVGPTWALPTTIYFLVAVIAHWLTFPRFAMTPLSHATCALAGGLLVATGACAYATTRVRLRRGFARGTLVTDGLYAIVRHPLYAISIFLIIPGVALLVHSWLLAPLPAVAYIACRVVVPKEDDDLHAQYGDDFDAYKTRTSALLPTWPRRPRVDTSTRGRKH